MNHGRFMALTCLVLLLAPGVSGSDQPQDSQSPSARMPGPAFAPTIGFGAGGSGTWTQLSPAGGGEIFPWGDDLVVSFSHGRGLWLYSMGEWSSLTTANPDALLVHCESIFASFARQGFWRYDRASGWSMLTTWEALHIVPDGASLIVDLGAGGLWRYDCPIANLTVGFLSDQSSPGPDTVSMAEGSTDGNLLTVDINVTQTAGVFGAAFDVLFDPNAVSFVSWSEGELLDQDGAAAFFTVVEAAPGRLVVGASRLGPASGIDAVGTVALIRLTFRALRAGMSSLQFDNQGLVDDQGGALEGIDWYGGSLVAN